MFRVAMPLAHVVNTDTSTDPFRQFYHSDGTSKFSVAAEFDERGELYENNTCQGIHITKNTSDQSTVPSDYNVYAYSDGFISVIGLKIVLRLVRGKLNKLKSDGKVDKTINYAAATEYMSLVPKGPQLRHVVYQFSQPLAEELMIEKVLAILNNSGHPARTIMRYHDPLFNNGSPVLLDEYLRDDSDGSRAQLIAQEVVWGFTELFVQAGDILADFSAPNLDVIISFHDSASHVNVEGIDDTRIAAGRPINPSYYLFQVQSAINDSRVTRLTRSIVNPIDYSQTHPMNFILDPIKVSNSEVGIDLFAAHPPKPLHVTVNVNDSTNQPIAAQGLLIDKLGDFHKSINASNPQKTDAVVRWKLYGSGIDETTYNDRGKIRLVAVAGQENLLPTDIDYNCAPQNKHLTKVKTYWTRYGTIISAVAASLQIPCEILMAISCTETNADNITDITLSHEMDVVRLEPLKGTPATVAPDNATHQSYLNLYHELAGANGANVDIPIPWSDSHVVEKVNPTSHTVTFTSTLTWGQLAEITGTYVSKAIVSPGIAQVILANISTVNSWIESIYGANYLSNIQINHNGVVLAVHPIPANATDVFKSWFGVSVDSSGSATTDPALVNVELTKMQRALHDLAISGAYIKQRCNFLITDKNNLISDFDVVTHLGSYNDGGNASNKNDKAQRTTAATEDQRNKLKWKCLFDLLVFSDYYPNDCPKFYNAVVELFNTEVGIGNLNGYVQPSVRLWQEYN